MNSKVKPRVTLLSRNYPSAKGKAHQTRRNRTSREIAERIRELICACDKIVAIPMPQVMADLEEGEGVGEGGMYIHVVSIARWWGLELLVE